MNVHGIHIILYAAAALCALSGVCVFFKSRKPAYALLCAGVLAHTAYQAGRGWLSGVFIPNGMFEGVFLLPLAVALLALAHQSYGERRPDWDSVTYLAIAFMAFALYYPHGIIPPTPQKISIWAAFFFLFEVPAHACFFAGGWLALRALMRLEGGNDFHPLLVWGFVFYSLAQFTGAVWCYQGWSVPFSWGARHLNSAAIWFTYAAYLHLRFLKGWDMRRKAWFAVAASLIVLCLSFASYLHEMNFERIGG